MADDDIRSVRVTSEVYDYLLAHGTPPDDVYQAIQADTAEVAGPFAGMQIGAEQAAFLTLLAQLTQARFAVEVGTFTGTSALAIARGLAPGGTLVCCDISEEWTAIARKHWEAAGVADRIDLRLGPALDTLRALPADPPVDLAFIDADKAGYVDYYEELVPRLRPGGLLVADNVLWSGQVVDADDQSDNTEAIRAFNDHVVADPRVSKVMLPVGDGVTLCRKLAN